jgi:Ca-activated chloride channel homolog
MKRLVASAVFVMLTLGYAQTYVQLVLDASGSMWNKLDDGTYRITAAKNVLGNFIKGLPTGDLNVGLRVYGATMNAMDEGSCDDIQLVVPMDGVNKTGLQTAVDETTAKGATPIVKALELAAADFPAEAAKKLIVLVTDGEESCGGDLNAIAEQLKSRGIEIELKIIGFALNEEAQKSFEGIGEFVNADDAEQLAGALETAVEEVVVEESAPVARQAVTLTVPATAPAGQFVEVSYDGTDLQEADYLTVVPVGTADDESGDYDYVDLETKTLMLSTPFESGEYEVRYVAGDTVLARAPITLEKSDITMRVVGGDVRAGANFQVEWTGPDGEEDYITFVKADVADGEESDYTYTSSGNPSELTAPLELGNYELRYQTGRNAEEDKVFARVPVEVLEAVPVFLQTEQEIIAGSEFEIEWVGPKNEFDIIGLSAVGASASENLGYTYIADEDSPTTLTAPIEPGEYEVRYINNNEDIVVATILVKVVEAIVSLKAPSEVIAGSAFEVEWTGPGNEFDIVAIASVGASAGTSESSDYGYIAGEANPFTLTAPSTPGDYEVRYINSSEEVVLASVPIKVLASDASLEVPSEIMAGSELEMTWSGTANDNTFITIMPVDAPEDDYEVLAYTNSGNPLTLATPFTPGDYEVRMLNANDYVIIARAPITLTEIQVTLQASKEIPANSESIDISWTGPNSVYAKIALVPVESVAEDYDDYDFAFAEGPSGTLTLYPSELSAGSYEVRYLSPDDEVLHSIPLTVK